MIITLLRYHGNQSEVHNAILSNFQNSPPRHNSCSDQDEVLQYLQLVLLSEIASLEFYCTKSSFEVLPPVSSDKEEKVIEKKSNFPTEQKYYRISQWLQVHESPVSLAKILSNIHSSWLSSQLDLV